MTNELFPKVKEQCRLEAKRQKRLKLQGELIIGITYGMLIFMVIMVQV